MPVWSWDIEHYGEGNEDMIGKFYVEDFENIKQIDTLVMQHYIHQERMRALKG